jgi:hypothetical protein
LAGAREMLAALVRRSVARVWPSMATSANSQAFGEVRAATSMASNCRCDWPRVGDSASCGRRRACTAGDDRKVMVHGVGTVWAMLRAGLLDEIQLHIVPVLLGQGRRLFEGLGADHIELETVQARRGAGGHPPALPRPAMNAFTVRPPSRRSWPVLSASGHRACGRCDAEGCPLCTRTSAGCPRSVRGSRRRPGGAAPRARSA